MFTISKTLLFGIESSFPISLAVSGVSEEAISPRISSTLFAELFTRFSAFLYLFRICGLVPEYAEKFIGLPSGTPLLYEKTGRLSMKAALDLHIVNILPPVISLRAGEYNPDRI